MRRLSGNEPPFKQADVDKNLEDKRPNALRLA
jgi:hypothetical protein